VNELLIVPTTLAFMVNSSDAQFKCWPSYFDVGELIEVQPQSRCRGNGCQTWRLPKPPSACNLVLISQTTFQLTTETYLRYAQELSKGVTVAITFFFLIVKNFLRWV
jgi:hypothetical protein